MKDSLAKDCLIMFVLPVLITVGLVSATYALSVDIFPAEEARAKSFDAAVEKAASEIREAIKDGKTNAYFSCHWDEDTRKNVASKFEKAGYRVECELVEAAGFGSYLNVRIKWGKK